MIFFSPFFPFLEIIEIIIPLYFRVYMDGIHLSVTVNLSEALELGKKVER